MSNWLYDTYDAYQSRVLVKSIVKNNKKYYIYRCSNLGGEVDYQLSDHILYDHILYDSPSKNLFDDMFIYLLLIIMLVFVLLFFILIVMR